MVQFTHMLVHGLGQKTCTPPPPKPPGGGFLFFPVYFRNVFFPLKISPRVFDGILRMADMRDWPAGRNLRFYDCFFIFSLSEMVSGNVENLTVNLKVQKKFRLRRALKYY